MLGRTRSRHSSLLSSILVVVVVGNSENCVCVISAKAKNSGCYVLSQFDKHFPGRMSSRLAAMFR